MRYIDAVASRRNLEDKLARLSELSGDSDETRRELTKSLADKSAHVVARAAAVVGDLGIAELVPELESSLEPFYDAPEKADKGCIAKTAIIKCLAKLDEGNPEVFLRGLHYVQLEPAYGGAVDTAVELRCESALGLVASGYPDTINELVTALTDKQAPVRLAAVRALATTGRSEARSAAAPTKRYSADEDLQVVSDALESLLVIAPRRSLPLAKRLLDSNDEAVAEAAALALGGSRCEEAFELLTSRVGDFDFDLPLTQTIFLALSMLRREEAAGVSHRFGGDGTSPSRRERHQSPSRSIATIPKFDNVSIKRWASARIRRCCWPCVRESSAPTKTYRIRADRQAIRRLHDHENSSRLCRGRDDSRLVFRRR